MHVLIVHARSSRRQGGTQTFLRNLVAHVTTDGVRVTVAFLEGGGLADDLAGEGHAVKVFDAGRLRNIARGIGTVAALRRFIRREAVTLVFSNGAYEHVYGGTAAWLAGVPCLWYCHGCSEQFDLMTQLACAVPARTVVTHGEYTKSVLARRCRAPMVLVPYGIDIPSRTNTAALRAEFGADGETPLIAMVGVFMPWKGQEVFIRAAARIRATLPSARFVLVGDAPFERHRPYADGLRRLAADLRVEDSVRFAGFRKDATAVMAASDVVVHASTDPEPFGIVLLEAMAVSRPVVTTGIGGARDVVGSSGNAVLVPPGDPVALADACIDLLADPERRTTLGIAGHQMVTNGFTVDVMVDRMRECFYDVSRAGSEHAAGHAAA